MKTLHKKEHYYEASILGLTSFKDSQNEVATE